MAKFGGGARPIRKEHKIPVLKKTRRIRRKLGKLNFVMILGLYALELDLHGNNYVKTLYYFVSEYLKSLF